MALTPCDQLQLLRKEATKSPENSSPLASPPLSNHKLQRRESYFQLNPMNVDSDTIEDLDIEQTQTAPRARDGLGIATFEKSTGFFHRANSSPVTIHSLEKSASIITSKKISTPGSMSGSTQCSPFFPQVDTTYDPYKSLGRTSTSSIRSDGGLASIRDRYGGFVPKHTCKSVKQVKHKMRNCFPMTILLLAIFSTFFSGAFLVMALRAPRYGRTIQTNGSLTAASAAFLTTLIAKLIELSFVTVFIAFLGQILARRVFVQETERGVTLAEISMRNWIMQPGSCIVQWGSVRYAGLTLLGMSSLVAAIVAMLYTSAATALVQPQLRFPGWEPTVLQGLVKTEFANPQYIEDTCNTPAPWDKEYAGSTCIQLEHAAQSYHNYFGWLDVWGNIAHNGSGTSDLATRPLGYALLTDNTTVTGPWIDQAYSNITDSFLKHAVIINNVSMAMPHSGIPQAAMSPKNDIMQPEELDGLGAYNIIGAVPSPVIHVLCATLSEDQLRPFVYELWPNTTTPSYQTWPQGLAYADPYLGGTPLDDVFGWGEKYGAKKWPPVFPSLPENYNTILNDTTNVPWGRDSIYLLARGGPTDSQGNNIQDQNYALCQMKASLTPHCSSHYNASTKGATLDAICDDPNDPYRYELSIKNPVSGNDSILLDWPNIASEWARSVALNDGQISGNGSNARLLTQLMITAPNNATPVLNPTMPSMAEALAVMSGCTLLQTTQDAPFVHFWNYTQHSLSPGVYQSFNASIRAQQYASGGTQSYQRAFIPVLLVVFVMNVVILLYFLLRWEWYTDFSEPGNLFSIAVNSPPSRELAGSCGGGIEGKHFRVSWKLSREGEHVYMESREGGDEGSVARMDSLRRWSQGVESMLSPVLKKRRTWGKDGGRRDYEKAEEQKESP